MNMCVPYGGIIIHLLSMSLFLIIMKNIGTINDIFPPKHVKSIISGHYWWCPLFPIFFPSSSSLCCPSTPLSLRIFIAIILLLSSRWILTNTKFTPSPSHFLFISDQLYGHLVQLPPHVHHLLQLTLRSSCSFFLFELCCCVGEACRSFSFLLFFTQSTAPPAPFCMSISVAVHLLRTNQRHQFFLLSPALLLHGYCSCGFSFFLFLGSGLYCPCSCWEDHFRMNQWPNISALFCPVLYCCYLCCLYFQRRQERSELTGHHCFPFFLLWLSLLLLLLNLRVVVAIDAIAATVAASPFFLVQQEKQLHRHLPHLNSFFFFPWISASGKVSCLHCFASLRDPCALVS